MVGTGSGPVPRDHFGRRQRPVRLLRRCERMRQFSLQPVESLGLGPFLVTPDQVADVFADVLVRPVITHVGRHEVTQRPTKANGHRCCSGHGTAPLASHVFNITKNEYATSGTARPDPASSPGTIRLIVMGRPGMDTHLGRPQEPAGSVDLHFLTPSRPSKGSAPTAAL